MSSSFGEIFRITTWGESHGPALGVVVEGVPAGLPLTVDEIQTELDRRRVGQSKVTTPRGEMDKATILSGVYEGITTGAPISMVTYNADADSSKYDNLRNVFRPGHADYTYWAKYGHRDHRGGGRSSARETWGRVAAGAIAKKILATVGTEVWGFTKSVADIEGETVDRTEVERNIVRAADPIAAEKMIAAIMAAKDAKDSLGGVIEVRATGVPVGLGEPTFDKIEALIAHGMMSIPATKGVEVGRGFAISQMKGSESNDSLSIVDGKIRAISNNAGGTLGGISTGEDIVVRVVVKPTSSIEQEQDTVGTDMQPTKITVYGRHDPSVVTRAVPVIEAMLAITLADLLLRNRSARI